MTKIIVALDYDNIDEAHDIVEKLGDSISFYKIGMELIYSGGLDYCKKLKNMGKNVFLDAKIHDIPTTVEKTISAISKIGVDIVSIHGYTQTMKAAKQNCHNTQIYAVSVLTSEDDNTIKNAGYSISFRGLLGWKTDLAVIHGMDGMICSAQDAKQIKSWASNMKIMCPGIRPQHHASNDQKRYATPQQAVINGADYMVIGRPITKSTDPKFAVEEIMNSIS